MRGKGFRILSQFSGRVPAGRRQPDFEISADGMFYGEGEWQSSYVKGFNQAIEFGDIPGCAGYFLIGYPDDLREKIRRGRLTSASPEELLASRTYRGMFKVEGRPTSLFQGSLKEIPHWVQQSIEKTAQLEQPEEFISLMRDIVQELTDYLPESGQYPSLFEHIIALMPKDKGEVQTAKKAAAYLLLNQVVFYRILSAGRGYPRIDAHKLEKPGDLKRLYFNRVLKDDYQAVFNFDVSSLFPIRTLKFITDMVRIIENVEPENFTRDLLGNIFHQLIPAEVRKPVAAYYTNPMAARLLARLSIKDSRDKVADFACGSGTLLMAAYEAKASLLGHKFREADHKAFIENDLTGIDIMPFAAHLAVIQLALKNPVYWTDAVRIAVHDSTDIKLNESIASLQTIMAKQTRFRITSSGDLETAVPEESRRGAISPSGSGKGFKLQRVNVVIMNPPFTRKQFINQDFRRTLTQRFGDYRPFISNEMSYWSYFVLIADRFLEPEGRIALVLPASILRQPSFLGIRRLLTQKYSMEYVITTEYRAAFSEGASFREVLLIARKTERRARHAAFATLKVLPGAQNVDSLANTMAKAFARTDSSTFEPYGQLKFIPQEEFTMNDDWFKLLPGEEKRLPELETAEGVSPLKNVVPNIIQGLRLNRQEPEMRPANTMLSHEREERTIIDWRITREDEDHVWAFNDDRAMELRFPKKVLVPSTRTATGMAKLIIDKIYDYVVIDRFRGDESFWDKTDPDQILPGRRNQIATRSAYLLVAGRGGLNLAAPGTRLLAFCTKNKIAPTWAFWSFRTRTYDEARILCLFWNSTFMLNQLIDVRTEVEGSRVWFGKEAINPLPVIDYGLLNQNQKTSLLGLFEELSSIEFPSILDQLRWGFDGRSRIDKAMAEILRISSFSNDDSIRRLQRDTLEKLESLRSMMGRK